MAERFRAVLEVWYCVFPAHRMTLLQVPLIQEPCKLVDNIEYRHAAVMYIGGIILCRKMLTFTKTTLELF